MAVVTTAGACSMAMVNSLGTCTMVWEECGLAVEPTL